MGGAVRSGAERSSAARSGAVRCGAVRAARAAVAAVVAVAVVAAAVEWAVVSAPRSRRNACPMSSYHGCGCQGAPGVEAPATRWASTHQRLAGRRSTGDSASVRECPST